MRTLDRMVAGFRSFRSVYYEQRPERVEVLVTEGQKPEVALIACSDSRVDPAILTNAEPGELFVIRNVANLVPPYTPDGKHHGTSAALEYAVRDLSVRDIIVLGHSRCGGIRALMQAQEQTSQPRPFVDPWMEIVAGCAHSHNADDVGRSALKASVLHLHQFPFVRKALEDGTLAVHGWWFDIVEGSLWRLEEQRGEFILLAGVPDPPDSSDPQGENDGVEIV